MPLDVVVTYSDNSTECFNIPLPFMRATKPDENKYNKYIVAEQWQWPNQDYILKIKPKSKPVKIEIDPSQRMADVNKLNNIYFFE